MPLASEIFSRMLEYAKQQSIESSHLICLFLNPQKLPAE